MVETTDEDAPPAPFNPMEFDAGSEETREATAAAGAMLLETINDDDPAPAPFNSLEFDSDNEEKMAATAATGAMLLETIDDDDDAAPAPFNSMEFEEHGADPSKPNAMQQTNISDEDSITLVPVHEDIRDESAQFQTGLASNQVPLFPASRAGMDRNDGRNCDIDIHTPPRNAVESLTHPMDNTLRAAGEEKEEVSGPDIILEADVERDVTIHIPEATLVVERNEE